MLIKFPLFQNKDRNALCSFMSSGRSKHSQFALSSPICHVTIFCIGHFGGTNLLAVVLPTYSIWNVHNYIYPRRMRDSLNNADNVY